MLDNADIDFLIEKINIKSVETRKLLGVFQKYSDRLHAVKMQSRKEEIASEPPREIDDPDNSGKKIKIPGVTFHVKEIFDVTPKNKLLDVDLTEEQRQTVFDDIKLKFKTS